MEERQTTTGGESEKLLGQYNENYRATETTTTDTVIRIPQDYPALLKRLRRVIRASLFFLNVLYGVAVVLLLLGFGLFSVIEWIAKHFGLAIGEGVCITGALIWLQRQYTITRGFLKRAQNSLGKKNLEDDLFKIISDALKYYANKAWNGLAIVVTAWSAPLLVKAPAYIAARTYTYNTRSREPSAPSERYIDGVRIVVGIAAAVIGFIATKALEKARKKSLQTIDDVVDHVDDMPEFDWVDKYRGDDSDSDDDSEDEGTKVDDRGHFYLGNL